MAYQKDQFVAEKCSRSSHYYEDLFVIIEVSFVDTLTALLELFILRMNRMELISFSNRSRGFYTKSRLRLL
jgi:hypothetical protein